jgi:hypothetical protein
VRSGDGNGGDSGGDSSGISLSVVCFKGGRTVPCSAASHFPQASGSVLANLLQID